MMTELGEVAGGVFGGKRGILSTKRLPSLPLRYIFYGNPYYCNNNLPKTSYLLVKSSSYIVRKAKPFQDMTISLEWFFLLFGGVLVVFLVKD